MLDGEEGAADIGVVCLLPEIEGQFPDWIGVGFVGDTGVGDQDVDGSEVGFSLGDAALDGVLGRNVASDCEELGR